MKVFTYIEDFKEVCAEGTCIALGNFDGVHKGHQALIKCCVETAKIKGLVPVVFTFLNHPNNVMAGKTLVKNIMTLEEKTEAIEALGIEYMVAAVFDESIMKCPPKDFVADILCTQLGMKHSVCGFNYSFGYKAMGKADLLSSLGQELGYECSIIPEVDIDGVTVSSTFIRSLIAEGRLNKYSLYTGRNYSIRGKVLQGNKIGRTIGFPTLNLSLEESWAQPLNGVYVTKTYVDDKCYGSVTNVGNKPTIGIYEKNAETHLFGFNEDIYGKNVKVEFLDLLREERKFGSIEELSKQIANDCINAEKALQTFSSVLL